MKSEWKLEGRGVDLAFALFPYRQKPHACVSITRNPYNLAPCVGFGLLIVLPWSEQLLFGALG